jgi:hypothetical protein
MKVSGFTFIKNALIFDYPIVEAIQSILPVCDEVVVAAGKSDDNTLQLIDSIYMGRKSAQRGKGAGAGNRQSVCGHFSGF